MNRLAKSLTFWLAVIPVAAHAAAANARIDCFPPAAYASHSAAILLPIGLKLKESKDPASFESAHFLVTSTVERTRLREFVRYADLCYPKLAEILGFTPNNGRKIVLNILPLGDTLYYSPDNGGLICIPQRILEEPGYAGWILVAFPHELTHYFLLQQFPSPPRWFIEGPASFFGDEVAESLGFRAEAAEDRKRFHDLGDFYDRSRQTYLFKSDWPEDRLPTGTPSPGMGASYLFCSEIRSLCGAEFFSGLFQAMIHDRVRFAESDSEQQRNWTLIAAMQRQTKQDLWRAFQVRGFR